MKALTLRFSNHTHHLITNAAQLEGVSISQFLREAALVRAIWIKVNNGDYDTQQFQGLYAQARAVLNAEDKRRRPRTENPAP